MSLMPAAELYIPIPQSVLPYILVKQLVGTSHHLLGRLNDIPLAHSSFSPYNPGALHPVIQIILVQFILLFISSWCNSSCYSYHPGAIHPVLHIILLQNS